MILVLKLIFAHIVADFFLQTDRMAKAKSEDGTARWIALVIHSLTHGLAAYAVVGDWDGWVTPIAIATSHFVIDTAKSLIGRSSAAVFVADQVAHLAVIAALCVAETEGGVGAMMSSVAERLPDNIWSLAIAYALMLKPTSILMSLVLGRWGKSIMAEASLPEAGKWIGYLERTMIVTFIITDNITGVGFLLAAKSVFRFGDLNKAQDIKTTEYVMIGTMASFAIAIAAALAVK